MNKTLVHRPCSPPSAACPRPRPATPRTSSLYRRRHGPQRAHRHPPQFKVGKKGTRDDEAATQRPHQDLSPTTSPRPRTGPRWRHFHHRRQDEQRGDRHEQSDTCRPAHRPRMPNGNKASTTAPATTVAPRYRPYSSWPRRRANRSGPSPPRELDPRHPGGYPTPTSATGDAAHATAAEQVVFGASVFQRRRSETGWTC